jgi:CRP-like cAMP-binding protein
MRAKRKHPFNVKAFLAGVNGGRTLLNLAKNHTVFTQGDIADAVFYVSEGRVKVSIVSAHGRRRSLPSMARANSSARAASPASRAAWRRW